jgi:hypothetical protein
LDRFIERRRQNPGDIRGRATNTQKSRQWKFGQSLQEKVKFRLPRAIMNLRICLIEPVQNDKYLIIVGLQWTQQHLKQISYPEIIRYLKSLGFQHLSGFTCSTHFFHTLISQSA